MTHSLPHNHPFEFQALEVRASFHGDERAHQLADLASENDENAAECAAADLSREYPASTV